MIDLRSDTLTQPTNEMRRAMSMAEVGDDGRTAPGGKGEDPTVVELERIAAEITGKEDALYCNSGTMANYISLLTHCRRGDEVLIGKDSHLYKNEQAPFLEEWGGLVPVFFKEDKQGFPDPSHVKEVLASRDIKLLCLENTHNFMGGTCLLQSQMKALCEAAHEKGVPVHLDGARIFNASIYLNLPVKEVVKDVDTLMFCLSKGLGAPVGSLLCGSREFILLARKIRKLLGGTMRQAGIIAAAGIVALESEVERLEEDHKHAYLLAKEINEIANLGIDLENVHTNIVKVDVSNRGFSAKELEQELLERGLKVKSVSDKYIRLTTYNGIQEVDIYKASKIFIEGVRKLEKVPGS
ncbi:GntG family PLP-dependent aldolase [Planococcus sp. X10-3]|uniref:GntG family PLP-dependent aldolase n=1 Tax=Planococcus sp. X10-3 TaxID=3061240 RepID=UPI003BAE291E